MIYITVHLFGHYSDYSGGEPLMLTVPAGSRIADVASLLADRDVRLSDLTRHCRFALEEEYTTLDAVVADGSVVAVLPPMSGG